MDTNEALRQRALRLIAQGVNQKMLADRMGLSQATFSRWINQKGRPVPVTALDGFQRYVQELRAALDQETQRPEALATGTAGGRFRGDTDRRGDDDAPGPGGGRRGTPDRGAT